MRKRIKEKKRSKNYPDERIKQQIKHRATGSFMLSCCRMSTSKSSQISSTRLCRRSVVSATPYRAVGRVRACVCAYVFAVAGDVFVL